MKIIADQDMYISSTWGASIRLYAGETKEVGEDLGLLALQEGARRVEDNETSKEAFAEKVGVITDVEVIEIQDADTRLWLERMIEKGWTVQRGQKNTAAEVLANSNTLYFLKK